MLDFQDYTDKYFNEEEFREQFYEDNDREPTDDEINEYVSTEYEAYLGEYQDRKYAEWRDK